MATLAAPSCDDHPLLSGLSHCGGAPAYGLSAMDRSAKGRDVDGWAPQRRSSQRMLAELGEAGGARERAVVAGLAASLEQLIHIAGAQRAGRSQFHARQAPAVSIFDYVVRLRTHFRCSVECFVLALVYMDRATKRHPDIEVGALTCHRLLAASLTLAAKFLDDECHSNLYYSGICSVPLRELNALERAMFAMLHGELAVKPEEFNLYSRILSRVGDSYLS